MTKQTTYKAYIGRNDEDADAEKPAKEIAREIALFFDGATFTPTGGFWKGKMENSMTLEVVGPSTPIFAKRFKTCAASIGAMLNQEEVLITSTPCTVDFVPSKVAGT